MQAKDLILSRFQSFSPTLQAAARFVVDHPTEVVITSMRTLANRAGVQPSTMVRLAQQVGYAGWPDLKDAFAKDLGLHSERYGPRARKLIAHAPHGELLTKTFGALRHNLDTTQEQCAASLYDAAKLLQSSKAVHVAGFRASLAIAHTLFYGYRLFRDTVYLMGDQIGGLELHLRSIRSQDAVVAVSFSPYSRESLQAIDAAKKVGASVLSFTDSSTSPLALAADVAVIFSSYSPSFFPSMAAAIGAAEALLAILIAHAGDAAAEKLEHAEQHLFELGAYLQLPEKPFPDMK